MVRITRVPTRQVHYVPDRPHRPYGPFSVETLARPVVVDDYVPQPDGGGDVVSGTAQNNYRAPVYYRCRVCQAVVGEQDLDTHTCKEEPQ